MHRGCSALTFAPKDGIRRLQSRRLVHCSGIGIASGHACYSQQIQLMATFSSFPSPWVSPILSEFPSEGSGCRSPHSQIAKLKPISRYISIHPPKLVYCPCSQTKAQIVFVMQFWYILAVSLVKLSILCLYGRLFSTGRYPLTIKIFLILTSAWLASFLFATFFQVWPLRCNWVTCIPTTNYTVMYVCCSVTDVLLDIAILCIPSSFIRTLHINRSQKIGLTGIFGLGVLYVH